MPGGWGGYVKPKKSKQQVALERRRELGAKYFSPLDELQLIASTARVKVKKIPCVPPQDPVVVRDPEAPLSGPCQTWVEGHRAWRKAGMPRSEAIPSEPTEREKNRTAAQEYNRSRYKSKKAVKAKAQERTGRASSQTKGTPVGVPRRVIVPN